MDYTMKLVYQSNYWYNDGLRKAQIYDLTGAISSLRKSLQYNRSNIAARNLLGLVYYGRGDVVEALVEWILSKNFQSHNNIANYYISKIQEVPGELEAINQAVKRYNQSLTYAQQNGEDLAIIQLKKAVDAHPTYVKAYQLLALMYLQTEQYTNARVAIRAAHKLDTTDPITLAYMHELNQIRKDRNVKLKGKDTQEQQTVTYNIGNETIIQPVSSTYKEHGGLHTAINIGLGVLVGVAVMWFLIMPAMISSRQEKINEQTVSFSDQIATQDAQISALKKELEEYRATSEESENAKATAESTQESYETLMSVSSHFSTGDMSDAAMLEEMLKIVPDSLGTAGRDRYEEIKETLFPRMCEDLYSTAKKNYEVANYETGISNLEKVLLMDETYDNGGAQLLLAQCYEKSGEKDKANIKYQKILEDFKDTEAAEGAQKALDEQNGVEADEEGEEGTTE
ncbi:MAG: hypothetical protein ACI4UH_02350 [Dorea sp.]